jgi:hypothetical protein
MPGRPNCGEPVNNSSSAGAWLNCSVCIDLMMQSSSAMAPRFGSASEIQVPL